MAKKYLMGLDLGTDSVGWCVTDENNKIIKKGGKSLWGARLFDEAQDCKSRRQNREARRRTQRRRERIDLLQLLFKEEIDKVDKNFFLRLNESFYKPEDKSESIKNDNNYLFIDKGFTDKDYKKKYPTIYHLRKALCETNDKADIRLIYLAIAHMVKYRGNFLYDVSEFKPSDIEKLNELLVSLNQAISSIPEDFDLDCEMLNLDSLDKSNFFTIMSNANGLTKKKEALANLFGKSKYTTNVVYPLIAGSSVKTNKIFPEYEEKISPDSLDFSSSNADDCIENLDELFPGDIRLQIIKVSREIYDYLLVGKLLGESKTISEAMVSSFDTHKKQLDGLKGYVRKHIPEQYDEIFRKPGDKDKNANYVMYVGKSSSVGTGKIRCGHCDRDKFYSYIKEKLGINKYKKAEDIEDATLRDIYQKIENKEYLPRQNSTDNSVFPYQLNKVELLQILETQSKYFPFLLRKDGDGISTIKKIEKLLTFKIPYYVGPLFENKQGETSQRGSHSWIKRYSDEKIYPWNFEKIVNIDQSATNFIERILNKCTYLPGEYCLPLNSLLFQRYQVLSLLNKTAINGKLMSKEIKEDLIECVFKAHKKATKKDISYYFRSKYSEEVVLTTSNGKEMEEEIPSMSSYVLFAEILGKEYVDNNPDVVENIIRDLTVFEDKKIIERRLKNEYKFTNPKIINRIKDQRMTGWANLSRKLLELPTSYNNEYGEIIQKKLIDVMNDTNYNLMELIYSDSFDFKKQIEEAQPVVSFNAKDPKQKHDAMVTYIDNCYVSPGMKRPLIQAMGIIEDVEKIIGHPIDEYYVECTRAKKKSKRTDSRKKKLLNLYSTAKRLATSCISDKFERKQITNRIDSLSKYIENEQDLGKFRSDKLFLYLSQFGKCMYSLEDIDLTELMNGSGKYDIDHIIPQSLVKDDSIDNRVLVKSERNKAKKEYFPIPKEVLAPGASRFYKMLFELKLIGKKKYENLTRTLPLTDDEKLSFVNRQLVYTNQAVKALVDAIKIFEKKEDGNEPKVVYSKAENVSNFRRDFDVIKVRDANHFHHAHDAYLNICIGRAVNLYFGDIRQRMIEKRLGSEKTLNVKKLFQDYESKNRKQLLDTDGSIVWDYQKSIGEIKENVFDRHDILTTTMQYIKHGELTNATIYPANADKGGNLVPVKKSGPLSDTAKYGGKNSVSKGFYTLIEHCSKNKKSVTLVPIPLFVTETPDIEKITTYIKYELKYNLVRVIVPCVRKNAKIVDGPSTACISNYGDKRYTIKNLSEPFFDEKQLTIIKKISKLKDAFPKYNNDIRKLINAETSTQIDSYSVYKDCAILNPATSSQPQAVLLTSDELLFLYDCLLTKFKSPCVKLMTGFRSVTNFLENNETKMRFANLDVVGKSVVLNQLMGLLNSKSDRADLSLINGGSGVGTSRVSQNLPSNISIVVESPTGYYTKVLWKGQE